AVKVCVSTDGGTTYTGYDFTAAATGQSVALNAPSGDAAKPYFPAGSSSTVKAYAYYPATAADVEGTPALTGTATFSVQDDQTSAAGYKASDLMTSIGTESPDNVPQTITKGVAASSNLSMRHLMAQLKITAQAQTGSGLSIHKVVVSAKKSVTFTPANGTATTTSDANGDITALTTDGGTGYVLIPVQQISNVTVSIWTDATGTADKTATFGFTSTNDFEAGESYSLDLTVTADQLGATTAITDWHGAGSVVIAPSGDLSIGTIADQTYDGSAKTPALTVKKGNTTLTLGATDGYNVQWLNNTNAGTAYAVVTGTGTYDGSVGVAAFTINKAAGSISYATATESKTYSTTKFTKALTQTSSPGTGFGTVTYSSSDPTVATVESSTGEVSLQKAGETTITATVADGANYTYATNTASYTLTVSKAAGSITFATASPSKTWSATTSQNTYQQAVTHTGNSTVTYAIGSTNTCGATISGNTVTFTKAGSVQVTATVADTDQYTYATKTASYTLTVNRATGSVVLSSTSGSVTAGQNATITVSSSHGGTLTAAATSGSTTRVGTISGPSSNTFTVPTNGTSGTSVTITVTCAQTDTYAQATATYTLTINSQYTLLSAAASSHIGQVVCSAGHVHASVSAIESGASAQAMICYISSTGHGLAIALADASSSCTWNNASSTVTSWANSHSVSGGTWRLPSADDWKYMFQGCGGGTYTSTLSDGMSYSYGNFRTKLNALGSYDVQSNNYWSSTEYDSGNAWRYYFGSSMFAWNAKSNRGYVRAVLAF
ncbi:MAG: fimbrillin family protein, partial [Prevotella sp.]|nr:fimbrillin family protein [Prevotella sp.]